MEFKKVENKEYKWSTVYKCSYVLTDEEVVTYKELEELKKKCDEAMKTFEQFAEKNKMSIGDYLVYSEDDYEQSDDNGVVYYDTKGEVVGSFQPREKSWGGYRTGWQSSAETC
jgi:hypothetical protein